MKFSKDLLELRDKEAKLVRMKRYEEAEKVKMKADLLEEFERNKLEAEVSNNIFIRWHQESKTARAILPLFPGKYRPFLLCHFKRKRETLSAAWMLLPVQSAL